MKKIWAKIKQFLCTPYGKAYLVFITLTKLYLVYKWALDYVKKFGGELFELIGASVTMGEQFSALSFTAVCGYYTIEAIISIFRSSPKKSRQATQA
ncbi:hypothetical protein C942_04290 [Photobacterium marinum]|uniref:Uncharacterized protein n=1 Tax=Photobacterium marinum TaxID=1056511 RepID=L8JGP3_9GAMM|nr:hypothetical protein [Photobacterium marinum]ELR66592.1 hypothetical protein C942_04290 [Photobacterium marinum]